MAPDNKNDDAFTGAIGVLRENSRQVDISQDKPFESVDRGAKDLRAWLCRKSRDH